MKVSILMSVHNCDPVCLRECLDSVRDQTFRDFELVMVDDGNPPDLFPEAVLSDYPFPFKIIKNERNLGLPRSLNIGLSYCEVEYIARMDADDIMEPERLEKQVAQITETPDAVVFTREQLIDAGGHPLKPYNRIVDSPSLNIGKYLIRSGNCLVHSSLMIKKETLVAVGGYDERYAYAQDYELYMRLIDRYEFVRLPDRLVRYRVPYGRISMQKRIMTLLNVYSAATLYYKRHPGVRSLLLFARKSLSIVRSVFLLLIEKEPKSL